MKAIIALLILSLPAIASDKDDIEIAMAMASVKLPEPAIPVPPKPPAMEEPRQTKHDFWRESLAQWKSQSLNVGSCPCGATGGCRCSPHSACAKGLCGVLNPILAKQIDRGPEFANKPGPNGELVVPRTEPGFVQPAVQTYRVVVPQTRRRLFCPSGH